MIDGILIACIFLLIVFGFVANLIMTRKGKQ